MQPQWKIEREIEKYIEAVAFSAIKRFYPTAVSQRARIPLSVAFDYLLDMAEKGALKLVWELRCPDYNCSRTIDVKSSKTEFKDGVRCVCGNYFEVSSSEFYPAFEINEEYREYIREEKKKDQIPSLILSVL